MLTKKQQSKLERLIEAYGNVRAEFAEDIDYYDDYYNEGQANSHANKRVMAAKKAIWIYLDSLRKRKKVKK